MILIDQVNFGSSLYQARIHRPTKISKEILPSHSVVVDVNNAVYVIVHVDSLHGCCFGIYRARADGRFLFVITRALELLALAIDIDGEVGVIMHRGWLIAKEANGQDDQDTQK